MAIKDLAKWEDYKSKNQDEYGKPIILVAERVMEYLDEGERELTPVEMIDLASKGLKARLSGFQAECVAQTVFDCHSRGEEFDTDKIAI